MANLLSNTTVGGSAVITTSNIGSYALTSITSGNVTTALGYTPYNATNPSGYISSITSGNVTTALGYTPYNATNPSGYITSSALSSYLPLTGGALTGGLYINNADPTIFLQDTNHRSAMIHVNSNVFYVLRGTGTNSTGWSTYNGYWPLEINLENNNAQFGGSVSAPVGDFRAPIFYDSQNTSYYLDPNSTSNLNVVNLSTLNASDTNARYYYQGTNGVPSNNLGNPTVTEMALFDEQFNNKTAFYNPASLTFWTSSDGTNYTEYTGFDTTTKKRFLGGDNDSGVFIPNLTNRFRIELENSAGYVFLNQLYIYWSSNSHSTKVHIWVRRCDNNQWYQWTNSNTQVSSWPGHLYLPFGGIPFYPGYLDSTGHYNRIRIEFIPSWASGTYSYTNISLMRMQIWGGYPAGKRNIYSTDENQNVTFPASITSGNSVISTNYQATNAYYLNGTSYFLNSTNGGIYTNARFETAGNLVVGGTTFLGNANGDEVHINDVLRLGATDSGDAHFFFGEGSSAGSDYGSHWYWDSGYTFTWNTRNNGTDTALFDYVTNDTTYLNWRRHFHMQNREINYVSQLHFNSGTRFVNYNSNYLYFQAGSASEGAIIVRDANTSVRGYSGYFDSNGFGLLNSSGGWGIRLNPGSAGTLLYFAGSERLRTDSSGAYITGRLDVSSYVYTPGAIIASNIQGGYQVLSLDTIKNPGLYQYDGGIGGTQPLGAEWSNVKTIEIGSGGRYSQFVMPYANSRIFYRIHLNDAWQSYVELITSGNIGSQSVNYATTAGALTSMNISQFTNNSGYITSGDTTTGIFTTYLGNGTSNISSGYTRVIRNENGAGGNPTYAPILHVAASDTMWQIAGAHAGGTTLVWRSGYSGAWNTPWWTIYHSGNFTDNSSNWNTAYGWGNHASAGYASTSASYANPVWITSLAYSKLTGVPAFLTAESDTLATVTGRGATTTNNITVGTLSTSKTAGNTLIQGFNATESSFSYKIYNNGSSTLSSAVFTQSLDYSGTTNGYISFTRGGGGSDGFLIFGDNGGERMRLAYGGNLGIGTTSPGSYRLYVNGGQYGTMLRGGDLGTGSDVVRMIKSDNSVAMLVRGDGNVGIGTTSPGAKLDVNGTVSVASSFNGLGYGSFGRTVDGSYRLIVAGTDATSGSYGLSITDSNGIQNLWVRNDGVTYLRGNVGIGTTSPGSKLHVNGDVKIGTYLYLGSEGSGSVLGDISTGNYLRFLVSNGERMRINASGSVGIGTTTPTAPVDAFGVRIGRNFSITDRATVRLDSNTSAYPADILFGHTSAANQSAWDGVYWSLSSRAANDNNNFYIYRGGGNPGGSGESVVMALQPNGNVGVGTTTPAEKLDVNGSINATGYKVNGVAGYTGMVTIQQAPPMPPVTFDIQNGIIVNVL